MISYPVYKLIHHIGIFMLMLSLGGLYLHSLNGGGREHRGRKVVAITHGIGMVLVLVAGFGLMARLGIAHAGWPGWIYVKMLIWLVLGAAIALAIRLPRLAPVLWWATLALGGVNAYLAIHKPF